MVFLATVCKSLFYLHDSCPWYDPSHILCLLVECGCSDCGKFGVTLFFCLLELFASCFKCSALRKELIKC